jgi:hypothetical protein
LRWCEGRSQHDNDDAAKWLIHVCYGWVKVLG